MMMVEAHLQLVRGGYCNMLDSTMSFIALEGFEAIKEAGFPVEDRTPKPVADFSFSCSGMKRFMHLGNSLKRR